jgi:hypothetical protein
VTPDEQVRADQIRARADAATEVLAIKAGAGTVEVIGVDGVSIATFYTTGDDLDRADANSILYEAARSDVPWLLDRLAAETAEVERLRDLVDEFRKRDESQDRIRTRLTVERDEARAEVERVSDLYCELFDVDSRLSARAMKAEAELAAETERADTAEAALAATERDRL